MRWRGRGRLQCRKRVLLASEGGGGGGKSTGRRGKAGIARFIIIISASSRPLTRRLPPSAAGDAQNTLLLPAKSAMGASVGTAVKGGRKRDEIANYIRSTRTVYINVYNRTRTHTPHMHTHTLTHAHDTHIAALLQIKSSGGDRRPGGRGRPAGEKASARRTGDCTHVGATRGTSYW